MWPFNSSGDGYRTRTFKCNSEKTTLEIGPVGGSDNQNSVVLAIYGLSSGPIVHHITDYNFYGIDTNNVIARYPTLPYTATQSC